ncbi:ATPase involved in DNA repair [Gemella morbillorum]|uniref:ABC transporter permease n=1 Tax=Gemella morbillorum TaxID=29391 RepID=UPI000DA3B24C|nr:ABC transporter permease [Gemella morbillorum]UBH80564.1 FtsX-like permease family protein [Gemella morbillorum]SQH55964.1 ATPase involved in DNA repair [Gemella morbillorum]
MRALNKDIIREISKTKSKFVSIMIIMFLGVFVFIGLKETTPAMVNTYNKTLEQHNIYDLRVTNNFGINNGDIEEIRKLENIDKLETYNKKNYKLENSTNSIDIETLPKELATPKVIKGKLPTTNNEIAVVDSLEKTYKIGDTINLVDDKSEEKKLKNYSYKVVGYVHGADHTEVSSNNPTNNSYFGYINRENFQFDNETGVNIKLKGISYKYSDRKYIEEVNKSRDQLIDILKERKLVDEKNYKSNTSQKIKESEERLASIEKELASNLERLELLKNVDIQRYAEQSSKLNEAKKQLQDNKKKLEVSKRAFEETNYPRFNVENIRGLVHYAEFIDSAGSLSFLANVFSIFLFSVSVLVSLTTLTRMVDENRTSIGTLKALGYSNRDIFKKYYIYGGVSTVIGTILGIIAGYLVIVPIIYNSYSRFFTLKEPYIVYNLHIIALAFLISILCILLAVFIPLRKNLKERSAYLLRPKAPSSGSRIFLENVSFIWKRLSFLRKVTFRNIFRYKVRMFMTIFGVMGCLTLMFIGFAIRFGVIDISNEQFKIINKIDVLATYNPYAEKEDIDKISKEIGSNSNVENFTKVNVQKATVEKNNEVLDTAQLVTLDRNNYKDYITLMDNRSNIELPKDSIVINEKLAYLYNLSVGDNFKVIINEKEYTLKIGAINKNYFGNILYMDREYFSKVFDKTYSDNSFIIKMNNSDEVEKMASKLQDNPYVVNVSDNSKIQENLDNFISGLDIIVVVMVLCSLALALVVLYNLINVNVSERQRELSTIKVLGFYPREVTIYVFREIFYLSIIGIVIGNYIAYRLYLKIILELASRTMMFSSRVPIAVYALSTGVTLVIIIFVMAIMHRRLKKVNMVESLKAIE